MPATSQPDIEIYLKDCTAAQVHAWLRSLFASCSDWHTAGRISHCHCDGIHAVWYERAVGSWHSLLFDSAATPWADDLACARAAFAALGCEARCAPGSWLEEQGEEAAARWLKVNRHGCQEFLWRT